MSRAVGPGTTSTQLLKPPPTNSPSLSEKEHEYVARLMSIQSLIDIITEGTEAEKQCRQLGQEIFRAAFKAAALDPSVEMPPSAAGMRALKRVCNALFTAGDNGVIFKGCVANNWKYVIQEEMTGVSTDGNRYKTPESDSDESSDAGNNSVLVFTDASEDDT